MICTECGAVDPEIMATHNYTIEYSEEDNKWVKTEGDAIYSCSNCEVILGIDEIADILRQVDEL